MNIYLLDHQCAHKFYILALYHSNEEALMLLCSDTSFTPGNSCTHWRYVKQGSFCRTTPAAIPHGLNSRKDPNLLVPISQNLQRKISDQGKVTLLLHTKLSASCWDSPTPPSPAPAHTPLCVLCLPDAR